MKKCIKKYLIYLLVLFFGFSLKYKSLNFTKKCEIYIKIKIIKSILINEVGIYIYNLLYFSDFPDDTFIYYAREIIKKII